MQICVFVCFLSHTSEVPPPKMWKFQNFISIFSVTIAGISRISCIYVLGHKEIPLCEYQACIFLNFVYEFFWINFNALKVMK